MRRFVSLVVFIMAVAPFGVAFARKGAVAPPAAAPVAPVTVADPTLGKRLFRHYCAACHGLGGAGDGVNADYLDPHPADLTGEEVQALSDAEVYEVIEKGGAALELSGAMPPWGKTLSADSIRNLVAYIRTLSGGAPKEGSKGAAVRFDDVRTGGKADCAICHVQPGEQKQRAPNLGYEGSKLNGGWLASFLKHPERIRPIGFLPLTKTKMPNFYFSDDEISALTSYLMTQKDARITGGEMAGVDLSDEGEVEKGRALFEDTFTCSGCHRMGGETGGRVGPDLSTTAKRLKPEWVFAWLKDPQSIRPDAPMPNFGMTDAEARSLVAYLFSVGERGMKEAPLGDAAQIAKGEKLVKDKNCLSCHILKPYNHPATEKVAAVTP